MGLWDEFIPKTFFFFFCCKKQFQGRSRKTVGSTEGHKVILHKEFLDSNPAGTITSKNPLLAQSQKWHALAQSHKKSKSARSVSLAGKSQGEPPIFGVRLESVP